MGSIGGLWHKSRVGDFPPPPGAGCFSDRHVLHEGDRTLVISHKYRFIFVHAGRTGGSTFERLAEMGVTWDKRTQHLGNTDFPEKHASIQYYQDRYPREFAEYFKFTLVRNPFDRVVSAWIWRTRVVKDVGPCSLKDFIRARRPSSSYASKFALRGASLRESIARLDYIGRFEDLPAPYEYLCRKLGIPSQSIPHTNRTPIEKYWEYYDAESVEMVRKLYPEDIEVFDYDFGK